MYLHDDNDGGKEREREKERKKKEREKMKERKREKERKKREKEQFTISCRLAGERGMKKIKETRRGQRNSKEKTRE